MEIKKEYFYKFSIFIIAILGVYIRFKGLVSNSSFWHDECALAWNIKFKSFSALFAPLEFNQMAPPFFSVITKVMTKIFGFHEYVFRVVPFIFGCSLIPLFYKLSQKILNKKFSIILAFFIFVFNTNIINYSFEFKPYGLDVFFTIVFLLFFLDFDIKTISLKKSLTYGILLTFIPWFSISSMFVIVSGLTIIFFKNFKNIKNDFIKKVALVLPLAVSLLLYLLTFLICNYHNSNYLLLFWQKYFINKGFGDFIKVFMLNISYLFIPINFIYLTTIFFLISFGIMFKLNKIFASISALSLGLILVCSYLNLYPFAARLVLFLFPIFLLIIIKPLDYISTNKKTLSIFLMIFYTSIFFQYIQRTYSFLAAPTLDRKEHPREMVGYLVKHLKPNDIIYVNNSSDADFAYYSSFYKINNKVIQEQAYLNISEQAYFEKLNSLDKGSYWFFAPIDYTNIPILPWFEEWISSKKIIYKNSTEAPYKSLLMHFVIN